METSQPLTTESFSFSWLTDKRPSFDCSSDDEELEFIVKSRRFLEEADNFNFDVPISNSSANTIVHADEIFCDGHVLPLYFDATTSVVPTTPIPSSFSSKTVYFTQSRRKYCRFFGKWKRSSKRVLLKCFKFLVPRKSIRVDDIDRKVSEVKSLSNSVQSSPHRNTGSTLGDWSKQISKRIDVCRTARKAKSWSNSPRESPQRVLPYSYSSKDAYCDAESSVYEAVLHCKRSFEK